MAEFTLRQLAYFVAVAQAGTIVEAAAALHVSPSAVSASLTDLERVLDAQLCVRRKAHGVSLTPTGARFFAQAKELLAQAEQIEHETKAPEGQLSGPLTVGCYLSLSPTVVPRLLQGFSERYPLVTLNFFEGTQDELTNRLASGELDLLVLYDMDVAPNPARVTLFSPRPYVIVHPKHPLAAAGRVALADLVDEPFILMDAPPSSQNTLAVFEARGLTPLVRHRTFSYELTRALVGRNLGYSVLVQRPFGDMTYEGNRISVLEIDPPAPAVEVILTWMQDARLSPAAAAMVTFARDEFAPTSPITPTV